MGLKDDPKNPRLSVHNQYKRRLNRLALTLSDFLVHAEMKLDPAIAGKIYKRGEIESLVAKCRELAALLPDPAEALNVPPVRDDFLEVLQATGGDTEKLLAEADAFLKALTPEDWAQMRAEYDPRKTSD